MPTYHSNRQSSVSKISLVSTQTTISVTTQTTTALATQAGLFDSNQLLLKYTDNVDSTDFVITSKSGVTTNVYYAFGLSNDVNMVK